MFSIENITKPARHSADKTSGPAFTGRNRGWISRHEAVLVDEQAIMVSEGKLWTADNDYVDQSGDFVLDPDRLTWRRV